jgi:hypothetical protein
MTNKSNQSDFRTLFPQYNDEEIIKVLKKRKQYQKEAAELAIEEAIKRGLIHSEQDLFAEEYQEKAMPFSIFPTIENDRNRTKIRKSIARILLILGAIPIVWGTIRIVDSNILEGILLIILGSIWIFAATKLLKEINLQKIYLMFVMLAVSVIYIVKLFISLKTQVLMDFLIPVTLYSFVVYGLLFIRRLK